MDNIISNLVTKEPKLVLGVAKKKDKNKEEKHFFIECSECEAHPIVGIRYNCLECYDYDLCQGCKDDKCHPEHKMALKSAPLGNWYF